MGNAAAAAVLAGGSQRLAVRPLPGREPARDRPRRTRRRLSPQLDAGLAVDACQWEVMTTVHAAVLDEAFARRIAAWPQVPAKVIDRLSIRLRWHGFLSAFVKSRASSGACISLQAFADRWGRVTPQGILVSVPVTHHQLGLMIGACRTSTSTAVSSLTREGVLERRDDCTWILPLSADRKSHESGRRGPSGDTQVPSIDVTARRAVRCGKGPAAWRGLALPPGGTAALRSGA